MIVEAHSLNASSVLECELCVVGSGAAGITLALELANTWQRIVLLTGGGVRESASDLDLYRGDADPVGSHDPLETHRRRMFGGTTSAWGGRCVRYDDIDFEKRDWVPDSGWPIDASEVRRYEQRALAWCEAGRADWNASTPLIDGLEGEALTSDILERWSPPTHFGRRYRKQLESAQNIRVIMDAHATVFERVAGSDDIRSVEARTHDGRKFKVVARRYVVACGGLENARLLLASDLGNERDLVGRYYQSHLAVTMACLEVNESAGELRHDFEKDSDGVYIRRRIWPTAVSQRRLQIGNLVAFVSRPGENSVQLQDPFFSGVYVAKFLQERLRFRSLQGASWDGFRFHAKNLGRALITRFPELAGIVRDRWFTRRRLPTVIARALDRKLAICFQGEHVPNRDSRVVLGDDVDAHGLRRLVAKPRFTDLDVRTLVESHRLVAQVVEQQGVGRLHWDEQAIIDNIRAQMRSFNSVAHHIGTTRMSADPASGVVDTDCRVHSVPNLWVAGASVFPTSSHANPTLMLTALTIRLAEKLRTLS